MGWGVHSRTVLAIQLTFFYMQVCCNWRGSLCTYYVWRSRIVGLVALGYGNLDALGIGGAQALVVYLIERESRSFHNDFPFWLKNSAS